MSNSFGTIFRITTWGESHGKAVGVVVDGVPAGIDVSDEDIIQELKARRPGVLPFTSPRQEEDRAEIFSGIFEGKTTGAPISIIIFNQDADSSSYESTRHLFKPGHAQFSYLQKYGIFDYKGSGRASARETVCRVAAGAIAKKILQHYNIQLTAYIKAIGPHTACIKEDCSVATLIQLKNASPLRCPDPQATQLMLATLEQVFNNKDSIGGVVELKVDPMIAGLGEPIYDKLEANFAKAMLSIPAAQGFEYGTGFQSARMQGSTHNDSFSIQDTKVVTCTNHCGGILGGISTGMPLSMKVAFKPTSSIGLSQTTITQTHQTTTFELPKHARHDCCIAIRAVAVVEAMAAIVIADALLLQRCSRLEF